MLQQGQLIVAVPWWNGKYWCVDAPDNGGMYLHVYGSLDNKHMFDGKCKVLFRCSFDADRTWNCHYEH